MIAEFLDFLYGKEEGFVYLPTLDPVTKRWDQRFYQWPQERKTIADSVATDSDKGLNVYIGPALYKEENAKAPFVKGSNVVWAEFDGTIPSDIELAKVGIPAPQMRIQSSGPGHEHWYWKLESFCTSLALVQETNRALAYSLSADPSGWDLTQVLRPLGSMNYKRSEPAEVRINEFSGEDSFSAISDFECLPKYESFFRKKDFKLENIPTVIETLHSFVWSPRETNAIYKKSAEDGRRNKLLTKIGVMCARKGMSSEQIFAIIQWVDKRPGWNKFASRNNATACYIALVDWIQNQFAREKEETGENSFFKVQNFMDHGTNIEPVEMLVDKIMGKNSQVIFLGESETGKTNLIIDMIVAFAQGRNWLTWELEQKKPLRILFLSLEMSGSELELWFPEIRERLSPEQLQLLRQNLFVYSEPDGFEASDPEHMKELIKQLEEKQIDLLVVDSLTNFTEMTMNDDQSVKTLVKQVKHIRDTMDVCTWFIHHPRKAQNGQTTRLHHGETSGNAQLVKQSTTQVMITRELNPETGLPLEPLRVRMTVTKGRLGARTRTDSEMVLEMLPNRKFRRIAAAELPPPDVQPGMLKYAEKQRSKLDGLATPYTKPKELGGSSPTTPKMPKGNNEGELEF